MPDLDRLQLHGKITDGKYKNKELGFEFTDNKLKIFLDGREITDLAANFRVEMDAGDKFMTFRVELIKVIGV